jgi:hypothetical protein
MEIVGRVRAWRLAALLARISTRQSSSALQKALCIRKPYFPIIPPLAICAPSFFSFFDVLLGGGSADTVAWLRVRYSMIDFWYW